MNSSFLLSLAGNVLRGVFAPNTLIAEGVKLGNDMIHDEKTVTPATKEELILQSVSTVAGLVQGYTKLENTKPQEKDLEDIEEALADDLVAVLQKHLSRF